MADIITYWAQWIVTHVPMITWVGLGIAGILGIAFMTKRYRECAMLAGVAAAYAITPYLPHMTHS